MTLCAGELGAMSESAVIIRPACALDAVNIAKLIKHTLGADQGLLRVNDHKVVQYVIQTIETSFVAVADMSGRLMGSLAMSPLQQPWSDDWFMSEAWFCVKPSVHTSDTAEQLLAAAEEFADSKRLPLFFRVPTDDAPKLALISDRHGFQVLGSHFLRGRQGGRDVHRAGSALATT